MQPERHVRHERPALAKESERQQQRERQHHHEDQRLRIQHDGLVEQRCERVQCGVRVGEAARDERLRQLVPVLLVQVRIERRAEDVLAGERLRREEQHVHEQEQLERRDERLAQAVRPRERQLARMAQQLRDRAQRACVEARHLVPGHVEHAPERQLALRHRRFAASRAEARREHRHAAGTGPTLRARFGHRSSVEHLDVVGVHAQAVALVHAHAVDDLDRAQAAAVHLHLEA